MSEMYPECPVYNHDNCKNRDNPKLCALVRKDKKCLKKLSKKVKKKKPSSKPKNKVKKQEKKPKQPFFDQDSMPNQKELPL